MEIFDINLPVTLRLTKKATHCPRCYRQVVGSWWSGKPSKTRGCFFFPVRRSRTFLSLNHANGQSSPAKTVTCLARSALFLSIFRHRRDLFCHPRSALRCVCTAKLKRLMQVRGRDNVEMGDQVGKLYWGISRAFVIQIGWQVRE